MLVLQNATSIVPDQLHPSFKISRYLISILASCTYVLSRSYSTNLGCKLTQPTHLYKMQRLFHGPRLIPSRVHSQLLCRSTLRWKLTQSSCTQTKNSPLSETWANLNQFKKKHAMLHSVHVITLYLIKIHKISRNQTKSETQFLIL